MQEQQERSPITLFYSYVHQDEDLCKELEKHLSILKRYAIISGWGHHKIMPGGDRNQINDEQFSSAQIIILLITPDFLASDASYAEMERALERHKVGLAFVIPLLLRPVDWQSTVFAQLQALPRDGKPVTMWENRDEAFADIAKDIRLAIKQWNDSSSKLLRQSTASRLPCPFLCSARKDLPLLKRLKEDLLVSGMMKVKDSQAFQQIVSDKDEKEDLREAIRSTSSVILVASPSTRRSRSIRQVLDIAEIYECPLYLFWLQGNHVREVIPPGYNYLLSFDAREERYPQALQDLVKTLGGQTSITSSQTPLSKHPIPLLGPPRNPYKGLEAFHAEDAQDFFGRDRLIDELLKKVQQLLKMDKQKNQIVPRLLTILGLSGSGKSSLVMAGLLPRLKRGGLSGSENWTYLFPMVPGAHPIETLALTLAPLFPRRSPFEIMHEDLEDDSARGLHVLLTMYVKSSSMRVLLVIDQFEELLTQTAIEKERRLFLELLLTAVTEPDGPLIVITTLRADFYGQPSQYPELRSLIEDQHVMCSLLDVRELRAVIEQPTQLPDVQITFEDGLVGDLLFEVQGQVGALPLLQFTLDRLFQYRQERLLTLHAYHHIGGVKGALAQHAESTYRSLFAENEQRLARALFLRLINPGTVVEDATRRRVPRSELVVMDQEETARLKKVTDAFIGARLLAANTVGRVPTVEVSHEALIQVWVRLQDWLHEARDDMRLQQAIGENAAYWNQHGKQADRLYRGSQLAQALKWREANLPSIDEDRFLQASVKERQRSRRRTFLMGLIVVGGMVGTGVLVRTLIESETKGLPRLIQPYTYTGFTDTVTSVAWSHDGKYIAAASDDKTVQVWDTSLDRRLISYSGHTDYVTSVAWSPDGKHIASGSDDKTVQVWDTGLDRRLNFSYAGHKNTVFSVAWSPNGKWIASGSADKTVQVWDANSGRLKFSYAGHKNAVFSVAWSPDSKRIASGSADGTVQVWDAGSGYRQLNYVGHTDYVFSIAWSPDGKRISSGSADKTVQVWDTHSSSLQFTYTGHTGTVTSVVWSPDGKYLASGSDDTTVRLWNASSSSLQFSYTGHNELINSVAWSPDGNSIASGSADDTVQVWNADSGHRQFNYTGHANAVFSVVWSPNGKWIASGSADKTVQVWDANSGHRQFSYTGHTGTIFSVSWSPDGKRIASGSRDKMVQVWDASSGRRQLIYASHADYVTSVSWSPDGKRIASGSYDTTVHIWDASSGRLQFSYTNYTGTVTSVVWSPDGKRIASGSADGTVQVWDANSGRHQFSYIGHTSTIFSVAWSPDSKRIASGSRDKTVRVWNATSRELIVEHDGPVASGV